MAKAGKYLFIVLVLLSVGFVSRAQRPRRRIIVVPVAPPGYYTPVPAPTQQLMNLRKMKEEFICKKLMLSPEQTNRFLVTYRHFEQDRSAIRVLKTLNLQADPNSDQLNKDAEYDRQLFEIRNHYRQEFLKIMPPDKVGIIYQAEAIFNEEVYRNSKERGGSAAAPPGR